MGVAVVGVAKQTKTIAIKSETNFKDRMKLSRGWSTVALIFSAGPYIVGAYASPFTSPYKPHHD
jgi:hypothetical protein